FTSFLFEPAFGVVDLARNTVHALGSWSTEVTVTTPEDIGLLTARILFTRPRLANRVVFVAGDTLSYGQLADRIDAALDRKVHRIEWTVQKLNDDVAAAPHDQMRKYRTVFAQGKGVAWDKRHTFNAAHGIELTTTADWINEHLKGQVAPACKSSSGMATYGASIRHVRCRLLNVPVTMSCGPPRCGQPASGVLRLAHRHPTVHSWSIRVVKLWLIMSRRMAHFGARVTRPGRSVLRPHLALTASSTSITRSAAAGGVDANRS